MLSTWSRDPFRVFEDVAGDMMDPFNTAFGGDYGNRGWDRRRMPQVTSRLTCMDAWEADDKFKVRLEFAGVTKENIDVSVDNGLLTIKVNKPMPENLQQTGGFVRNEIVYGNDSRTVRIPRGYHPEPEHCQFRDGCLCLAFPKSQESEAKRLQIESA